MAGRAFGASTRSAILLAAIGVIEATRVTATGADAAGTADGGEATPVRALTAMAAVAPTASRRGMRALVCVRVTTTSLGFVAAQGRRTTGRVGR